MGKPRVKVCGNCKHNYGGYCYGAPPVFSGGLKVRPQVDDDEWCGMFIKRVQPEKKEKSTDGLTPKMVVNYYSECWGHTFGTRAIVTKKDYVAAKNLIEALTPSDIKKYIKLFFENPPKWNRENHAYGLSLLPSAINQMVSREATPAPKKRFNINEAREWVEQQEKEYGGEDRWDEFAQYVMSTFNLLGYEEWNTKTRAST